MTLRLVLDTNIVLDLLHFFDRHTAALQCAIAAGRVRCFSDHDCLAELERVSAYPQFALAAPARAALLAGYRAMVSQLEAEPGEDATLPRCRDVDDQKFLVLAARARADFLITRDRQLLRLAKHRDAPCAIITARALGDLPGDLLGGASAAEDPVRFAGR